jgi:hypothetical protein
MPGGSSRAKGPYYQPGGQRSRGALECLNGLANIAFANLDHVIRQRLRIIHRQPGMSNGCLTGTGLTLDPEPPRRHHALKVSRPIPPASRACRNAGLPGRGAADGWYARSWLSRWGWRSHGCCSWQRRTGSHTKPQLQSLDAGTPHMTVPGSTPAVCICPMPICLKQKSPARISQGKPNRFRPYWRIPRRVRTSTMRTSPARNSLTLISPASNGLRIRRC